MSAFTENDETKLAEEIRSVIDIAERYARYKDDLSIRCRLQAIEELTDQFVRIVAEDKETNLITSRNFNVLRLFKIPETQHSYLLAKLLDPRAEHGQGMLFLRVFLEMLGIKDPKEGTWHVTAEKGRIDILLKRQDPHSVIIIENKSNDACDRPNQLYRYWHQEIYRPTQNRGIGYAAEHPEYYQIIYLPSGDWKTPDVNSLSKPYRWDNGLPERIPLEPITWSFDRQVIEWLEECLKQLLVNNFRMRDYVLQYIELWR